MRNIFYTIQSGDNYWSLSEKYHIPVEKIWSMNRYVDPYHLMVGQVIQLPTLYDSDLRSSCISKKAMELHNTMRLLWEQHIMWTRLAILSLVFDLPDTDVVVARLLQNATDMGNSLKPFYGASIAQTYADLIKEHLLIAADLVKAAKTGNNAMVADAEKKWYANADQIVEFITQINPYIPKEEFREMFYEHLRLTKAEAVYMLTKDYKSGVDVYDQIEADALEMADMITNGIMKQFPTLFQ